MGDDVATLLQRGLSLHQAGRAAEAEAVYRRVLEISPGQADALHLLGVLALQTGHIDAAIELIGSAIRVAPDRPPYFNNLSVAFGARGEWSSACRALRSAVTIKPDYVDALAGLGASLDAAGDRAAARSAFGRTLAVSPERAQAHHALGVLLQGMGDAPAASRCYRRALCLHPDLADSHSNLAAAGIAPGQPELAIRCRRALAVTYASPAALTNLANELHFAGRSTEAGRLLRHALVFMPSFSSALVNLAKLGFEANRLEAAIASGRRVLAILRQDVDVLVNIGVAALALSQNGLAAASLRKAIALRPDFADAHLNLGNAHRATGRIDQAISALDRTIACRPDFAEAAWNRAIYDLTTGNYERGWKGFESRWRTGAYRNVTVSALPRWQGEAVQGRTILLGAEQGLGDSLQFARFAPVLAGMGARVLLECSRPLRRVLQTLGGTVDVIEPGQAPPGVDFWQSLMSLPRWLGITLANIPPAPYLSAEAALAARWQDRLGPREGDLRVGLVWAGNPEYRGDRSRSPRLRPLLPLIDTPGVRFHALQLGDGRRDLEGLSMPRGFVDLGPEIGDLADTAAILSSLDLVITSDTGPAHLAGALGTPTWLLLEHLPDWRWLDQGDTSPWYGSMRLWRQREAGNWAEVVTRVAPALAALAQDRGARA